METEEIISALQSERDRLERAIAILRGSNNRPQYGKRHRHLSASARRRISLAQKKRWAEQRKAAS